MDEMRVEVGVTESVMTLVRGHMERMGDENLEKRTHAQKVEGK